MWPLPAPHLVVHPFAPPAHDWMPGHRGVDLAAEPGVQVVAAGVGRVVFAGVIDRVGVVAIRHPDGLETTYEPLRPAVRAGAQVAAGAVIGRVERLGSHCAPRTCLHWGLRRGAAYLDPLGLVGAERVRLLPLLTDSARPTWPVSAAAGSSTVILGWAMASTRRRRRDPRAP
jgi:murein DD-endopeptidase MepM/ murein hydrolase activator NlpD